MTSRGVLTWKIICFSMSSYVQFTWAPKCNNNQTRSSQNAQLKEPNLSTYYVPHLLPRAKSKQSVFASCPAADEARFRGAGDCWTTLRGCVSCVFQRERPPGSLHQGGIFDGLKNLAVLYNTSWSSWSCPQDVIEVIIMERINGLSEKLQRKELLLELINYYLSMCFISSVSLVSVCTWNMLLLIDWTHYWLANIHFTKYMASRFISEQNICFKINFLFSQYPISVDSSK